MAKAEPVYFVDAIGSTLEKNKDSLSLMQVFGANADKICEIDKQLKQPNLSKDETKQLLARRKLVEITIHNDVKRMTQSSYADKQDHGMIYSTLKIPMGKVKVKQVLTQSQLENLVPKTKTPRKQTL